MGEQPGNPTPGIFQSRHPKVEDYGATLTESFYRWRQGLGGGVRSG